MKRADVFKRNYFATADLGGKKRRVTISSVVMEAVGQDKEEKAVLYAAELDKGVILNNTNWATLEDELGGDSDDWTGATIELRSEMTQFQGKRVPGLRSACCLSPAPK